MYSAKYCYNSHEYKRSGVFFIMKCPLMSSTDNNYNVLCQEEDCAWYVKAFKSCAMYIIAHNAALDIKAKQTKQR